MTNPVCSMQSVFMRPGIGAQQRGTVGAVFDGAAGDVVEVVRFLARVCTLVGNQLTVVHETLATLLTLVGVNVSVSSFYM